jgi:hypothetical protein
MKHSHTIYLFLLLALAAISYEGCTLIGYGIGSGIDYIHDKNADYTKPIFRDSRRDSGQIARIQYTDSSFHLAMFNGYTDELDSAYQMRWNSFVSSHRNSSTIPFKIGDSICFEDERHDQYVGQLEDYCPDSIDTRFTTKNERGPVSGWTYLGKPRGTNLSDTLRLALDSNAVPVRAILHFTDNEKSFTLTNSDFYNAKFIENWNAKSYGLEIGAVIDVAIIAAFVIEIAIHPGAFQFQGGP